MMPRIRTVKPEFWDSPSTKMAGPWARLLYIAMWNWADDFGRGTANLKELEGFAFPNDDTFTDSSGNTVNFRSLVAEVSECFGVTLYEVDGRPYYAINSWDRHQRNERRAATSKYPEPPSQNDSSGNTVNFRSLVAETPRISGPGTGEQGNRGTGENTPSSTDVDGEFQAWWKHYPRKVDKGHALKAYKTARRKVDAETLTAAVQAYAEKVGNSEARYIAHAATWLNGERWADTEPEPAADPYEWGQ